MSKRLLVWAVLTTCCVGGSSLQAGAQPRSLSILPGQTALQSRIGGSINDVCSGLQQAGVSRFRATQVSDLYARCQDMVQTGNSLIGEGATDFDLGLNAQQTNDAIVSLSHEELSLAGVDAINIVSATFGVLESRLVALREDAPLGVQIAGLPLMDPAGRPLVGAERALRENSAAGDALDDRIGLFANVFGNWGDFDGTSEEAAFDFDQYGVVAGGDYRFTERFSAGAAFTYSDTGADFEGNGADGGDLDRDAYTGSIYATWDTGGLYVDGIVSYTALEYDMDRRIRYANVSRTARGDTDADEWAASIGVGYNWHRGGFTFGPYLRTEYIDVEVDGFGESGAFGLNLEYEDTDIRSLTTDLGIAGSYAWSTSFGVVSPYLRAEWEHEYENDSRRINARYQADPNRTNFFAKTSSPDRDYFNVGAGVTVSFPRGFSAFVDFDTVLGLDDVDRYLLTLGARIQF